RFGESRVFVLLSSPLGIELLLFFSVSGKRATRWPARRDTHFRTCRALPACRRRGRRSPGPRRDWRRRSPKIARRRSTPLRGRCGKGGSHERTLEKAPERMPPIEAAFFVYG